MDGWIKFSIKGCKVTKNVINYSILFNLFLDPIQSCSENKKTKWNGIFCVYEMKSWMHFVYVLYIFVCYYRMCLWWTLRWGLIQKSPSTASTMPGAPNTPQESLRWHQTRITDKLTAGLQNELTRTHWRSRPTHRRNVAEHIQITSKASLGSVTHNPSLGITNKNSWLEDVCE